MALAVIDVYCVVVYKKAGLRPKCASAVNYRPIRKYSTWA